MVGRNGCTCMCEQFFTGVDILVFLSMCYLYVCTYVSNECCRSPIPNYSYIQSTNLHSDNSSPDFSSEIRYYSGVHNCIPVHMCVHKFTRVFMCVFVCVLVCVWCVCVFAHDSTLPPTLWSSLLQFPAYLCRPQTSPRPPLQME